MLARVLIAIAAAVALLVVAFAVLFGTLDPCTALRAEYRRAGERDAGPLAGAMLGVAGDINTSSLTAAQCARKAMRLRFLGRSALEELRRAP